ncbi:protein PAL OF QUIRKY-like [Primulina eburnea]|uniref:protein PAL OF QUIRKY-like n=1 Tax=Primulina eburnea TaxID=1245227 RepID=UPI003C6C8A3B
MNPKISPPSSAASKLRLMCSHGGYIVPRPHDKSLFYAGGETRIVALDRRTTAASLSALTTHLSRAIFNNRPFHLKYQLPYEGLDSLISVVTDEDLLNMLEEHDRITPPSRIRLFLFTVKPESLGSTLLDPKSETWFCDALKSTRILPKGQSADSGLLMGLGSEIETPAECGGISVEDSHGAELALETSLSFKSTGSSNSMANSPQIGIGQCEDNGSNLLQRKNRVPSSASIESDNSAGSAAPPSKTGIYQESLVQIPIEAPSFHIEPESTFLDHSCNLPTSEPVKVLGYPTSQQPDGKQLQHESQDIQGNLHYIPQYVANPMSISQYYPVYQMPSYHQHVPCPTNLPYPIHLVPIRSTQHLHTSMQCYFIDANNPSSLNRPPLHPQTAAVAPPVTHKEISGAQPVTESTTKSYKNVLDDTLLVSIPSSSDQLVVVPNETQIPSEPVPTTSVPSSMPGDDFDEDIAYNPIYKTQPTPPVLPSQYQTLKMGTTLLLSESSVHRQM